MANTYLSRSLASTSTSWTFSAWVKRSGISATNYIISWGNNGTDGTGIGFASSDELFYYTEGTGSQIKTSAKYRDTNGFYHVVVKSDSNAITLYINGEEPTQAWTSGSNGVALDTSTMQIGKWVTSAYYHNGSMSHIHFTDGTAYDASAFGSTDSTTGEWEINTSPSVTYGTNGFFILKDGNSVTDQSGEGNDFTVGGGTLTNTEDNPSNVFAVNNPLASSGITIAFGNTSAYKAGAGWNNVSSTLGASTGKYYAECKVNGTGTNGVGIGFVNLNKSNLQNSSVQGGEDAFSAGIYSNSGAIFYASGTTWKTVGALSDNDIVQLAMDLDNGFLYWGKNGTWFDSANPASGATGTGGLALSNLSSGGTYTFNTSVRSGGDVRWNYGNGYFEITAVSSAGTNASGIGIFEYDVPTGYTALSTKGLNL